MSIFKTGLSIDPNSYVDAVEKQSKLFDLQRRNQQIKDESEFLANINQARGDIVGGAPDTSAPQSAGLRKMIERNPDGTYGTPVPKPEVKDPMATLSLGNALPARDEAVTPFDRQRAARDRIAQTKGLASGLLQDKEGRDITLFGSLTRPGDWFTGVDTAESYLLGARDKFADPEYEDYLKKALPYQTSTSEDYAKEYAEAQAIGPAVMEAVAKRGRGESLNDREQELVRRYDINPRIYSDTSFTDRLARERAEDIYKGSKQARAEIDKFQKEKEVTVDNTGRVVRVSDGKTVGIQKIKDTRGFWDKALDPNGVVSGFKMLQDAADKINKDITADKNYLKEPAEAGKDIKKALDTRKDLAFSAREYYGLAQIAAQNGNMKDYQSYMRIADAYKTNIDQQDDQIVYLEGMQSLNELTQGSTGRASKVWSLFSGRDVQIIKRDDGNFDVTIDGQQQRTGVSLKRLSDELRLQFDTGHRTRLAQAAIERAKLAFANNLEIKKEYVKLLAQAKTEKMKLVIQGIIDEAKAGKAKLFQDSYGLYKGTIFVNRNGVVTALRQSETEIDGKTQTSLQEVPVSQLAGGNQYLSSYD